MLRYCAYFVQLFIIVHGLFAVKLLVNRDRLYPSWSILNFVFPRGYLDIFSGKFGVVPFNLVQCIVLSGILLLVLIN